MSSYTHPAVRSRTARFTPWAVSGVLSLLVVSVMLVLSGRQMYTALQVALLVPGLITIALLPGAWRRWYRWVAIAALANITFPAFLSILLVVSFTWAIHQSWWVERTGDVRPRIGANLRLPHIGVGTARKQPTSTPKATS